MQDNSAHLEEVDYGLVWRVTGTGGRDDCASRIWFCPVPPSRGSVSRAARLGRSAMDGLVASLPAACRRGFFAEVAWSPPALARALRAMQQVDRAVYCGGGDPCAPGRRTF